MIQTSKSVCRKFRRSD